ncbi:hypothetical protein [Massilia psychrophila]|uniref:hypothetical protein n=1 Tax=Massilia psychrophila TaxID=1603353 RepID=UPI00117CA783
MRFDPVAGFSFAALTLAGGDQQVAVGRAARPHLSGISHQFHARVETPAADIDAFLGRIDLRGDVLEAVLSANENLQCTVVADWVRGVLMLQQPLGGTARSAFFFADVNGLRSFDCICHGAFPNGSVCSSVVLPI